MLAKDIKLKRTYRYTSRKHAGSGKVLEKYDGATGTWVKLLDPERGATVTVRPTQVEDIAK